MKRIACISLLLCILCPVMAQPILKGTNINPSVGEVFSRTHFLAAPVTQGPAGPGVYWNFAGLTLESDETLTWVEPDDTPDGIYFPHATLAFETSDGSYYYYSASSGVFSYQGTSNGAKYISYNNPERLINYPLSYNTVFQDSFSAAWLSGGVIHWRKGEVTVTGDAYGSLELHYGVLENVLRIRIEENFEDRYNSGGWTISNYHVVTYQWYLPGTHFPVMSLTVTDNYGPLSKYGYILDEISIDLTKPVTIDNIKVAINHNSEVLTVTYTDPTRQNFELELVDLQGRNISEQSFSAFSNEVTASLDLNGVPAGIYLLNIKRGKTTDVRKVLIR